MNTLLLVLYFVTYFLGVIWFIISLGNVSRIMLDNIALGLQRQNERLWIISLIGSILFMLESMICKTIIESLS